MTKKCNRTTDNADPIVAAINRIASQFIQDNGETSAYLCSVTLPRQFTESAAEANNLFKKIQSDFCKSVFRGTGTTPRYVAVRASNEKRPEYRFALFTPSDAPLDQPDNYADHGRAIANTKCGRIGGWANGKMDVVEMLLDQPTFKISHEPIHLSPVNRDEALRSLEDHLGPKADAIDGKRSLFVSKIVHQ